MLLLPKQLQSAIQQGLLEPRQVSQVRQLLAAVVSHFPKRNMALDTQHLKKWADVYFSGLTKLGSAASETADEAKQDRVDDAAIEFLGLKGRFLQLLGSDDVCAWLELYWDLVANDSSAKLKSYGFSPVKLGENSVEMSLEELVYRQLKIAASISAELNQLFGLVHVLAHWQKLCRQASQDLPNTASATTGVVGQLSVTVSWRLYVEMLPAYQFWQHAVLQAIAIVFSGKLELPSVMGRLSTNDFPDLLTLPADTIPTAPAEVSRAWGRRYKELVLAACWPADVVVNALTQVLHDLPGNVEYSGDLNLSDFDKVLEVLGSLIEQCKAAKKNNGDVYHVLKRKLAVFKIIYSFYASMPETTADFQPEALSKLLEELNQYLSKHPIAVQSRRMSAVGSFRPRRRSRVAKVVAADTYVTVYGKMAAPIMEYFLELEGSFARCQQCLEQKFVSPSEISLARLQWLADRLKTGLPRHFPVALIAAYQASSVYQDRKIAEFELAYKFPNTFPDFEAKRAELAGMLGQHLQDALTPERVVKAVSAATREKKTARDTTSDAIYDWLRDMLLSDDGLTIELTLEEQRQILVLVITGELLQLCYAPTQYPAPVDTDDEADAVAYNTRIVSVHQDYCQRLSQLFGRYFTFIDDNRLADELPPVAMTAHRLLIQAQAAITELQAVIYHAVENGLPLSEVMANAVKAAMRPAK